MNQQPPTVALGEIARRRVCKSHFSCASLGSGFGHGARVPFSMMLECSIPGSVKRLYSCRTSLPFRGWTQAVRGVGGRGTRGKTHAEP
eukprot:2905069-Rhodomonas_salina.2